MSPAKVAQPQSKNWKGNTNGGHIFSANLQRGVVGDWLGNTREQRTNIF